MNATPEKPEMSRHEASWHEHLAGMRAAALARKQGADPRFTEALADATAGPVMIGGYALHPASEGTIWTLRRVAREFAEWANSIGMPVAADHEPDGTRELLELGLSTLVFCDPLRVWNALQTGGLPDLIVEAQDLIFQTPVDIYQKLEAHFHFEMQRIRQLAPSAPAPQKKTPEIPAGESPAMQTPPTAIPSPASNGSAPNTPFPSPMPYGGPVS